ncbi:MAG: hypothetical protein V2A54_10705 [Bacteroidota bacterium]
MTRLFIFLCGLILIAGCKRDELPPCLCPGEKEGLLCIRSEYIDGKCIGYVRHYYGINDSILKLEFYPEGGNMQSRFYFYDSLNRIHEISIIENGKPDRKRVFEYDETGLLTAIHFYENQTESYSYVNSYNSLKQLIKKQRFNGTIPDTIYNYIYYTSGKLYRAKTYNADNTLLHYFENEFFQDMNKTSYYDGSDSLLKYDVSFLNVLGNPEKKLYFNSSEVEYATELFEYDASPRLTKSEFKAYDGSSSRATYYRYN